MPSGESGAIATYFTAEHGKASFVLRGVRASRKRMPLALEAFHTLRLRYLPRAAELWSLESAELLTARLRIGEDLDAAYAAGTYLRWLAALTAPRQPDVDLFAECMHQLDALSARVGTAAGWQVGAGVRLLAHAGYALVLGACVLCGRERPAHRPALASAERGGVICQRCAHGTSPWTLSAAALALLASSSESEPPRDALEQAQRFLDAAFRAHTEIAS